MQLQPVTGKTVSVRDLPKRMRVVDVIRSLRADGYQLLITRHGFIAVRIH